jgi:hypothetical protein
MPDPTVVTGRTTAQRRSQPTTIMNTVLPPASQIGAASIASGQVTATGSAQTLIAARATRRSVSVMNTSASDPVYIGPATVSASNGHYIPPRGSVSVDTIALIQVIATAGVIVTWLESYE